MRVHCKIIDRRIYDVLILSIRDHVHVEPSSTWNHFQEHGEKDMEEHLRLVHKVHICRQSNQLDQERKIPKRNKPG